MKLLQQAVWYPKKTRSSLNGNYREKIRSSLFPCSLSFPLVRLPHGSSLRIEYSGAVYHVTSRDNEKKSVFKDDTGRENFLNALQHIN